MPLYQSFSLLDGNESVEDGKNGDGNLGSIYGNPDEDLDFQVLQNPYYGGEVEMGEDGFSIPMDNLNMNNTEVITSTQNDYYEM